MRKFIAHILLLTVLPVAGQPVGHAMASGEWYKLSVTKAGVYKIDYELLRQMGVDPATINPVHLRVFGNEGGMLPQPNAAARPDGLQENAILVSGESDGRFDNGDFILFFAEGPDIARYDPAREAFFYEKNLYSDANFYFLCIGDMPGKRIQTSPDAGPGHPAISTFDDYYHHELDTYNDQHSGRDWFGEKFGISTLVHTFDIPLPGIVAGSPVSVVSDVMGQSLTSAQFKVSLNGVEVGTHNILPITNSRYSEKGINARDTFRIDADVAGIDGQPTFGIGYEFIRGTGSSQAYLDFFTLTVERELRLYGNGTIFTSGESLENQVSEFRVGGIRASTRIWDITDIYDVRAQDHRLSNGVATFSTQTSSLRRFVVFGPEVGKPEIVGEVANQDLRSISASDMIIVAHPTFLSEAQRLAAHREAFSGWKIEVVTTDEVYNEFSSGRQDVSAIRDFAKSVYENSSGTLKALLLFGRSSYDYKDRVPENTNFVPTYESRNSLHPLQSYSSDDYFAFLEDHEGEWEEHHNVGYTLDIGVGRLPVVSLEQARNVVDKIIAYDTDRGSIGYWRKRVAFVADDGNNADGYSVVHQHQANQLATFLEAPTRGVDTEKLFMGTYQKLVRPNGETIPDLTSDIVRTFDRGALIINYTGHGSERQWGDENVFDHEDIAGLENRLHPFLVTATCEFGRHDDPGRISSAEMSILQPEGGSIGLVTTARLVNVETNFNLNLAFYEALFQRDGNRFFHIGEVFRQTKNNSTSGVANRNFSLLGDPSMTLALPPHVVHLTELKTASGSDTLKALSTVIAKGEIRTFTNTRIDSFNGVLTATLFDKQGEIQTIGRNNPPFTYSEWDNALFRGRATVVNGTFELRFTLPKNIDYAVDFGRISFYAYDTLTLDEAAGAAADFKVGETEQGVSNESMSPTVTLFMGDTTFVNGGIITPDSWLLARISDNTGINISNYGIGNSIIATLDTDAETFVLNDYYIADVDDPTSGWLRFPVKDLEPGRHTFTVKAWDLFNNAAAATVDFIVTDGERIVIESFGNYPNPFDALTTLFFTHNRSGDHLQAELSIHDMAGGLIRTFEFDLPDSGYRTELVELSGDDISKKAAPGIYIARLIVRSLTNGSKNEQVTKLFLSN